MNTHVTFWSAFIFSVHIKGTHKWNTHLCMPLGCAVHHFECVAQPREYTGMGEVCLYGAVKYCATPVSVYVLYPSPNAASDLAIKALQLFDIYQFIFRQMLQMLRRYRCWWWILQGWERNFQFWDINSHCQGRVVTSQIIHTKLILHSQIVENNIRIF